MASVPPRRPAIEHRVFSTAAPAPGTVSLAALWPEPMPLSSPESKPIGLHHANEEPSRPGEGLATLHLHADTAPAYTAPCDLVNRETR